MKAQKRLAKQRERRGYRVRNRVMRSAHGRARLSVFRSNRHMYAQIIDDQAGRTLVAANTLETAVSGPGTVAGNCEAATKVGKLIAQRAAEHGIKEVIFDRGGVRYHGRVAALADAARAEGLRF